MRNVTNRNTVVACAACLAIGWTLGAGEPSRLSAQQPAAKKVENTPLLTAGRLGGNLYLQASAEYRACCYGIYHCATQRLDGMLEAARPRPARPAVVMDLDETVFDNSAFQTFLYENHLEYTDALWAAYEENYPQDVTLIPGAKDFIWRANELGVTVIFISNRLEQFKKSTISALEALNVGVGGDLEPRLLLKASDARTGDKAARREAVAAKYNVLMYFGDNLRDFSESFANALPAKPTPEDYPRAYQARAALADAARPHWGVDWFVLPNPVYGEWDRAIGPDPLAIMHRSSMKAKGQSTNR